MTNPAHPEHPALATILKAAMVLDECHKHKGLAQELRNHARDIQLAYVQEKMAEALELARRCELELARKEGD